MLFHTGFPRSIWLLLRSNPPLHKCFLRAKGYHCHFCGLLPAGFLWKTLLSLQTLIFSPQPSTTSRHLLSPFCSLCCTKIRVGCGLWERSRHGRSWFVRWVTWWQLPSKGVWLGNGDSKPCQGAKELLRALPGPSALPDPLLHQWIRP